MRLSVCFPITKSSKCWFLFSHSKLRPSNCDPRDQMQPGPFAPCDSRLNFPMTIATHAAWPAIEQVRKKNSCHLVREARNGTCLEDGYDPVVAFCWNGCILDPSRWGWRWSWRLVDVAVAMCGSTVYSPSHFYRKRVTTQLPESAKKIGSHWSWNGQGPKDPVSWLPRDEAKLIHKPSQQFSPISERRKLTGNGWVTSSVEEFPPLSSAMVLALPFQTQQTAFRCSIEPVTLLEAWKVVQKVVVSCFFPNTKLFAIQELEILGKWHVKVHAFRVFHILLWKGGDYTRVRSSRRQRFVHFSWVHESRFSSSFQDIPNNYK